MLARKLDIRRRMSTLSLSKGLSLFSAAHLPVPKSLSAKSCISISSKLIEIKGLFSYSSVPVACTEQFRSNLRAFPQVQLFPHIRDTPGGGGLVIPIRLGP